MAARRTFSLLLVLIIVAVATANNAEPETSKAEAEAGSAEAEKSSAEAEKSSAEAEAEKAGAEGEGAKTGNAGAEVAGSAEPKSEAESAAPEAEERPSPMEIVLPPFALMFFIVIALIFLSLWSQNNRQAMKLRRFVRSLRSLKPKRPPSPVQDAFAVKVHPENESPPPPYYDSLLDDFDREVLSSMGTFMNRPWELLRISGPALLSLALCPATLYLYVPFVNLFWPPAKFKTGAPDINDAIACFLAPAGLVYATSFGFAFQSALNKQHAIMQKVTYELGLLDQIVTLATKLNLSSLAERIEIYKAAKCEAIYMILQIQGRDPDDFTHSPKEDVKVKIWSIIDILRRIVPDEHVTFDLDRVLADKIVNHMLELNSICSDRLGTFHTRIHPLKWAFLESLGFFSFFGILLLRAESYRMELTMCIITVFSISLLCYVVSDLDSPFSGFFRIDVSVIPDILRRMEEMHDAAKSGHNVLCQYPERN